MASAGHDGAILRQWIRIPLHCRQTSDPEEVKMATCKPLAFWVIATAMLDYIYIQSNCQAGSLFQIAHHQMA